MAADLKLDLKADKDADRTQPPASFRERPPSSRRCSSALASSATRQSAALSADGAFAAQQKAAPISQLFDRLHARLDEQAEEMRAQQHELLQEVHAQREELAAHKRMLEMYAQVRRVVRTTIHGPGSGGQGSTWP